MNNPAPFPTTKWDTLTNDEKLMAWNKLKLDIEDLKAEEMDLRKLIVRSAFPEAVEGTNTIELGNGYKLKGVVKYNYKLPDNDAVEAGLKKLESLGNQGPFIADRIVGWTASFKLTEYRLLEEDAEKGDKFSIDALAIIHSFLEISEAAPTLTITEPKVKK